MKIGVATGLFTLAWGCALVSADEAQKSSGGLDLALPDSAMVFHYHGLELDRKFDQHIPIPIDTEAEKLKYSDKVNSPEVVVMTKALVRATMADFNDQILKGSYLAFYNNISNAWKRQVTIRQIEEAFLPFVTNKVDLSNVKHMEPVFDVPLRVSEDSLLIAQGHYDTHPYLVYFSMKYIHEAGQWKLFGINVDLKEASTGR